MGTKFLAQTSNEVFQLKTKYLRDSELKQWLVKNRVFEELFNLDTHDQIMEIGGDIIKFMIRTSNSLEK